MNGNPTTPKSILVADDEASILRVVSLKLRNAGFEVITAQDGEEAWELACQKTPDLLITDLQMPFLTGLELCRRMREHPATSAVPALMLTARGVNLRPDELLKTNIVLVMTKPFSPRGILENVQRLLFGESATIAP